MGSTRTKLTQGNNAEQHKTFWEDECTCSLRNNVRYLYDGECAHTYFQDLDFFGCHRKIHTYFKPMWTVFFATREFELPPVLQNISHRTSEIYSYYLFDMGKVMHIDARNLGGLKRNGNIIR